MAAAPGVGEAARSRRRRGQRGGALATRSSRGAPALRAVLALAGSTLGFALAHRARPGLHLATGVAFGGVYLATGALAACIAAHLTYNLCSSALRERLEPRGGSAGDRRRARPGDEALRSCAALTRLVRRRRGRGRGAARPERRGKIDCDRRYSACGVPTKGGQALRSRSTTRPDEAAVGATPQETTFPATLRVREVIELVRAHYPSPLPSSLCANGSSSADS